MQDADFTKGDSLSAEVEVNLNMLGSLMLNRVGGESDGADVVAINHCSTTEWTSKL
jgi:hypothetical protein